ncbi:MAG: hypothetical protein ABI837_12970 [Acidobacteriota bacterium]
MKQQPSLVSQQSSVSYPSSENLGQAILWDFALTVDAEGLATLDVRWNESRRDSYALVLENADGAAQIRTSGGSEPLPLVLMAETTPVAIDGAYQYRLADGSLLAFEDAAAMRLWTIVFEQLDVRAVQSARASVEGVAFTEPLIPFIENDAAINIGGAADTLVGHLTSLLQTLLAGSPLASQTVELECRYGYLLGGVEIAAPVVLLPRQDLSTGSDDIIVAEVARSIEQWLVAVEPPATEARLIFSVSLWSGIVDAPVLRLGKLLLPMTDVVR